MELFASSRNRIDSKSVVGGELRDMIERVAAGFQLGGGAVNDNRAGAVGAFESAQQDRTVKFVFAAGQHGGRRFAYERVRHIKHRVDGAGQPAKLWVLVQSDDTGFEVALSGLVAHLGDLLYGSLFGFARSFA